MLVALDLLSLSIVLLAAFAIAVALHPVDTSRVASRQDLIWPNGLFDLLWLLLAGVFLWAVKMLTSTSQPGRLDSPVLPRRLALFSAVVWLVAGVAGGIYQWSVPLEPISMNALLTGKLIGKIAGLASDSAWIGTLWVLLDLARWQYARAHRGWLVAALALTAASAVAGMVHFGFWLRRHFALQAILEGRGEEIPSWPSRAPVEDAGMVAGLIALITLLVTLIALLRLRWLLRRIGPACELVNR